MTQPQLLPQLHSQPPQMLGFSALSPPLTTQLSEAHQGVLAELHVSSASLPSMQHSPL